MIITGTIGTLVWLAVKRIRRWLEPEYMKARRYWAQLLRSGEFEQFADNLRFSNGDGKKYCCVWGVGIIAYERLTGKSCPIGDNISVPPQVRTFFNTEGVFRLGDGRTSTLMFQNDHFHMNFRELADIIVSKRLINLGEA